MKREKKKGKGKTKGIRKGKKKVVIDKNMSINELLARYPSLVEFFMQKGHFCVGCPYANETLEEFCLSNGINFKKLKKEIEEFIKNKKIF